MSREEDYLIDKWLGHFVYPEYPAYVKAHMNSVKHFTSSDADALSLVATLTERGYKGSLNYHPNGYDFSILSKDWGRVIVQQPTIAAAISTAVLELIAFLNKEPQAAA